MKKYILLLLSLFISLIHAQEKSMPDWQVDPNQYQYTATITAKVLLNNAAIPSGTVILGAFSGSQVRGTATPIVFNGEKYFFLTVYTNSATDTIRFKVYYGNTDSVVDGSEVLPIVPNGVYGSVASPFTIHSYLGFNHAPVLKGIPNQSTGQGGVFPAINLRNYLTELDNDPVRFSARRNKYVTVSISADTAKITYPANWYGTDTVFFRATEQTTAALFGQDTVLFTVQRVDHAPEFTGIPAQLIGKNAQFSNLNLRSYVNESDGDSITFSYVFNATGSNDPTPSWTVNPASFNASMTIIATVDFPGGTVNGNNNLLAAFVNGEVRGVASGFNFSGRQYFFLTVYANSGNDTISFRYYDGTVRKNCSTTNRLKFSANATVGNLTESYSIKAGNILVSIGSNGIVAVNRADQQWTGTDRIRFTVHDFGTINSYTDTLTVPFTVLNDNIPLIRNIPDQWVVAPQNFAPVNLASYISELDGNTVSLSASLNTHVQVLISPLNVATFSVNPANWTGSESVVFRVTDNTANSLYSEDTVTFTMRPSDSAPVFSYIPVQAAVAGGVFQQVALRSYTQEYDGDSLQYQIAVKPSLPNSSSPSWSVTPAQFNQTMNLTIEMTSAGVKPTGYFHKLAVFFGNTVRGVATPVQFGNKWLYFLTVYANTSGEKLSFKFYDAQMQKIYPVKGSISFSANTTIGSPTAPLNLEAGNILFAIQPNNKLSAVIVDSTWTGTETLTVVATDAITPNHLADTTEITYKIGNLPAVQLTAFIEGLYRPLTDTMTGDTVAVLVKRGVSPFETIDSVKITLNTNGYGVAAFGEANTSDNYYIAVKHRNSLETWSKNTITFGSGAVIYNFTTDSSSAYGNNLHKKGNKWCMITGDVNQDGVIDENDLLQTDAASLNFLTGYRVEDVNGDLITDITDLMIIDNNRYLQSSAYTPAQSHPKK